MIGTHPPHCSCKGSTCHMCLKRQALVVFNCWSCQKNENELHACGLYPNNTGCVKQTKSLNMFVSNAVLLLELFHIIAHNVERCLCYDSRSTGKIYRGLTDLWDTTVIIIFSDQQLLANFMMQRNTFNLLCGSCECCFTDKRTLEMTMCEQGQSQSQVAMSLAVVDPWTHCQGGLTLY